MYLDSLLALACTQKCSTLRGLDKRGTGFFFISKGRHIPVLKGEHFSIGVVEKAIQDTDNAIKTTLFDANLPRKYWDIVGEHCNLILQMSSPSRSDPNITIFEACYQRTPNLDVIPRVGCFAVRVEPPKQQQDTKLDPRNRTGTFLGYQNCGLKTLP